MKPRISNIKALRGLVMFTMIFVNDLASAQNERLMVAADPPKAGAGALGDVFHAGKLAELDAAIDQAINDSKMVGAVLWVERQGAAYHKAFGQRATKPAAEAMTEDTIFAWPPSPRLWPPRARRCGAWTVASSLWMTPWRSICRSSPAKAARR